MISETSQQVGCVDLEDVIKLLLFWSTDVCEHLDHVWNRSHMMTWTSVGVTQPELSIGSRSSFVKVPPSSFSTSWLSVWSHDLGHTHVTWSEDCDFLRKALTKEGRKEGKRRAGRMVECWQTEEGAFVLWCVWPVGLKRQRRRRADFLTFIYYSVPSWCKPPQPQGRLLHRLWCNTRSCGDGRKHELCKLNTSWLLHFISFTGVFSQVPKQTSAALLYTSFLLTSWSQSCNFKVTEALNLSTGKYFMHFSQQTNRENRENLCELPSKMEETLILFLLQLGLFRDSNFMNRNLTSGHTTWGVLCSLVTHLFVLVRTLLVY